MYINGQSIALIIKGFNAIYDLALALLQVHRLFRLNKLTVTVIFYLSKINRKYLDTCNSPKPRSVDGRDEQNV